MPAPPSSGFGAMTARPPSAPGAFRVPEPSPPRAGVRVPLAGSRPVVPANPTEIIVTDARAVEKSGAGAGAEAATPTADEIAKARDPKTAAHELIDLAYRVPALRPHLLENPALEPSLRDWLSAQSG
ncbi:MAG: hypothetical protein QM662_08150 [Gordonia sp. (in: high G+C Gram-positive bacteria)]